MASKSKIQWTEGTWNPWHGCKKVSAGCKYCYMYRDKERYGQDPTTVLRSKSNFNAPLKWNEPKLIFTCSWSDWFIDEADEWRHEAWDVIKRTPQHTYQILTKRPERIWQNLPLDWGNGYNNVWLGVSVENQDTAFDRMDTLAEIPSKVNFLSCEPLIGPIEFDQELLSFIDWVIVGGESGNSEGKYQYRPCNLNWIDSIMSQCGFRGVPVFVKQLGTYLARELSLNDRHGGNIDEWPEHLRFREMPDYPMNDSSLEPF